MFLYLSAISVVLFLMVSLKAEVAQAESSLLQAAASCPLYGRAHCITAILQQLDTRYSTITVISNSLQCHFVSACDSLCVFFACSSLQLENEWRRAVTELLTLCYRICDVVAPVVQSSSPEGLIPMDTDSGKNC